MQDIKIFLLIIQKIFHANNNFEHLKIQEASYIKFDKPLLIELISKLAIIFENG